METKKFNIGIGMTNECNMHCEFCYSKIARNTGDICKLDVWKKFVDANHRYIDSINYGTGENTIVDDFFHFADYIRKYYPYIKQALTTNGYLSKRVSENMLFMKIFDNCIDEVDVSIDFNSCEKHGNFRGQPNAFNWATQTLLISKNLGKPTTIVFVGCNETFNKENLDGLFILANNYNSLLRMNIYRPTSDVYYINNKFVLSYDNLVNGLHYIYDNYEIVSLSDALLGNIFTNQESLKDASGVNSIRILPTGAIYPSTYLISDKYKSKFNIKKVDLKSLRFDQFEKVEIPKECSDCVCVNSCAGGVYDRRILWYGTFSERDPYCPTRYGEKILCNRFSISKPSRVTIHDGYLPTLFFKNRG